MKFGLVIATSLISASALAGQLNFKCYPSAGYWPTNPFAMTLKSNTASIVVNENDKTASGQTQGTGTYDSSYAPSAKYADYVRYAGFEQLADEESLMDQVAVLVQKDVLKGGKALPKGGRGGDVVVVIKGTDGGSYTHALCVLEQR